jgi:hypothetical protein
VLTGTAPGRTARGEGEREGDGAGAEGEREHGDLPLPCHLIGLGGWNDVITIYLAGRSTVLGGVLFITILMCYTFHTLQKP